MEGPPIVFASCGSAKGKLHSSPPIRTPSIFDLFDNANLSAVECDDPPDLVTVSTEASLSFYHADIETVADFSIDQESSATYQEGVLDLPQYICPADVELLQQSLWYTTPDTACASSYNNSYHSHTEPELGEIERQLSDYTIPKQSSSGLCSAARSLDAAQKHHRQPKKKLAEPVRDWISRNGLFSYPDRAQVSALAEASGLSVRQIRSCLNNHRARNKPKSSTGQTRNETCMNFLESSSPAQVLFSHDDALFDFNSIEENKVIMRDSSFEAVTSNMLIGFDAPQSNSIVDKTLDQRFAQNMPIGDDIAIEMSALPGRKGKRRHMPRPHLSSEQATTFSPSTSGDNACDVIKAYHCTVCSKSFINVYGWRRHEGSVHAHSDIEWICMLDGKISRKTDCLFCLNTAGETDHFQQHDIEACLVKCNAERTFSRKDLLKQHVQLAHLALANEYIQRGFQVPKSWSRKVDPSLQNPDALWCGFCQYMLDTIPARMEHVAQHFANGENMMSWKPRLPA